MSVIDLVEGPYQR